MLGWESLQELKLITKNVIVKLNQFLKKSDAEHPDNSKIKSNQGTE